MGSAIQSRLNNDIDMLMSPVVYDKHMKEFGAFSEALRKRLASAGFRPKDVGAIFTDLCMRLAEDLRSIITDTY